MQIPDFIQRNEPLARYSTLGVGGKADYFANVDIGIRENNIGGICGASQQLLEAYDFARDKDLDIFILGGGSNILFGDLGFGGLVVRLRDDSGVNFSGRNILASAGTMVSELVQLGRHHGLTGFEFLAGLPGTVGGAIYGNAGCYGGQFWDTVERVYFFDGEYIHGQDASPDMFSYRTSLFKQRPNLIILAVQLKLKLLGKNVVAIRTRDVLRRRSGSQPKARSVGCIFKNPPPPCKVGAGRLIDSLGLRTVRVGGAMISKEHGNFFVNTGDATASDFIDLIGEARARVHGAFGIMLEEEIIRVGGF